VSILWIFLVTPLFQSLNAFQQSRLILRGQIQVVTTLFGHAIKTIPAPSIKIINELISILNSMPELYHHYSAFADTKYMKKRSKWLKDVEHFKITLQGSAQIDQTGLFSHALNTLNLISGDRKTILKHSNNRNDAIVAVLLYSCTSTARRELADVVRLVDKTFPVHVSDTSAEACRAFMLGEIYEGIVACASEDWWLVAHLTDLMEMVDLLETRSNLGLMVDENDVELREYFVLNYAQSLFSHGSLWEHALFYLSTCPTQGLSWMREVSIK
jgi:nuclear pore complex protein Nup85